METISIVMPAYNCEKYVEEAIKSIKEQTNKNWTLIIIDDASYDNTLKKIKKEIEDIKEKVVLIKNKNKLGIAKSRNRGIQEANGRYISFLDSDDVWNKEKLQKQLEFMKKNNYGFTYTNFSYKKQDKIKKVKLFPRKLDYNNALKNTFILTSTVMIDTNRINKKLIEMPDIPSEDTATWWNILKDKNIAYGIKENLVMYRVHKEGESFNKLKNIKRTWNLYRKYEKIGFAKSAYYFSIYSIMAVLKRII